MGSWCSWLRHVCCSCCRKKPDVRRDARHREIRDREHHDELCNEVMEKDELPPPEEEDQTPYAFEEDQLGLTSKEWKVIMDEEKQKLGNLHNTYFRDLSSGGITSNGVSFSSIPAYYEDMSDGSEAYNHARQMWAMARQRENIVDEVDDHGICREYHTTPEVDEMIAQVLEYQKFMVNEED